ncbi:MAG: sulfite exporter TauE/SafE family protein [Actinobacteria bacterium]|nr:sulfite exporter TauE/SafE family protein [Actinomycetota bacterium]MBA3654991.1 sulfite exporter TauE/SafE family protein [Actinomycetota bacterium]
MTDVGYLAAFGGGVVSFASPCVLPIVPGYLSIITGLDIAELQDGSRRHLITITRDTGLFVAGFSIVFILLGVSATTFGAVIFRNHALLTRVSGLAVLTMALFLAGSLVLRSPWLYQEKRFHPSPSRLGPFAAPIAGAAFGFGWTPCIGPVLGSVLAVAATQHDAGRGAALLAAYSVGLGLPFLATGLAFGRLTGAFGWVKRHFTAITAASSASLAFFGVLLTLNRLTWLTSQLQALLRHVGLERLVFLG